MMETIYVIEAQHGQYYKNADQPHEFTNNVMSARKFKKVDTAQFYADKFVEFWKRNERIYCGLTGKPAPYAIVRKVTINITIE